jgi:hypothetical protein
VARGDRGLEPVPNCSCSSRLTSGASTTTVSAKLQRLRALLKELDEAL